MPGLEHTTWVACGTRELVVALNPNRFWDSTASKDKEKKYFLPPDKCSSGMVFFFFFSFSNFILFLNFT